MSSENKCTLKPPLQGAIKCEWIFSQMVEFPLWFNRDHSVIPEVPEELLPYTVGRKFLSTKQVPSCLLLRHSGSSTVRRDREKLLRSGFTLSERKQDDLGNIHFQDHTALRAAGSRPQYSDVLTSLLVESNELNDLQNQPGNEGNLSDEEHSGPEKEFEPGDFEKAPGSKILLRKSQFKIKYDDPWKIQAGTVYSGLKNSVQEVVVWSGDGIRLQDPLPPRILGKSWKGSARNRIRFHAVGDLEAKHFLLFKHTHWGKALTEYCNDRSNETRYFWSRRLRTRINRFLSGAHDPCMSNAQIREIFADPHEGKSQKARSLRFIEMLKTVDGIFLQRYLSYPEEVWTWERFDAFTLGNISNLIGDEFLDGTLTEAGVSIISAYSQLKSARKWFKETSHRGGALNKATIGSAVPTWLMQFHNVWTRVNSAKGQRREYLVGVLSQTRGCGTPPPIVLLQSKRKFLLTVSAEPVKLTPTKRLLVRKALSEVLDELPEEAFTGLQTKSRVTVTTASSWEKTRREGGTIEEVRKLISSFDADTGVPVRDLVTGKIVKYCEPAAFKSIGELIFWSCLDTVLRTPRGQLTNAFLTIVKEPGKARSVTKARTCLKIVLDVVSKICSVPLKRGIKSSASGMGASNHGWNLFLRLHSEELRDMVFSVKSREDTAYAGYVERTETYEDLFVVSTDYSEATDRTQHELAAILGDAWMLKCGIPPVLRGIVHGTCFKPRNVFFHATGVLKSIGDAVPEYGTDINYITLRQGVLMGDPLTKIVLHLTNIVSRRIGSRLYDRDFYSTFRNANEAHERFLSSVRKSYDTGKSNEMF